MCCAGRKKGGRGSVWCKESGSGSGGEERAERAYVGAHHEIHITRPWNFVGSIEKGEGGVFRTCSRIYINMI